MDLPASSGAHTGRRRWRDIGGGEEPNKWKKNETWRLAGRAGDLETQPAEVWRSAPTDSQTLVVPGSSSLHLSISHRPWSIRFSTFFLHKRIRCGGFIFQFLSPEEYATLDPSISFCQCVGRAGPVGLALVYPIDSIRESVLNKTALRPLEALGKGARH